MVEFGMQPMDAIQSATSRAAVMLEMEGKIGVVAPGAFADIVAVSGDPLHDIKVLESVPVRDERRVSLPGESRRNRSGNGLVSEDGRSADVLFANFLDKRFAAIIMRQSSLQSVEFGSGATGAGGGVYERAGAL